MRVAWVFLLLATFASPRLAQKNKKSKRCSGTPVDSTAMAGPIYQDCQVDKPAKRKGASPRLNWESSAGASPNGRCYRAEFQFVVNEFGGVVPGSIQATSSNDATFEQAVQGSLVRLRYEPAKLDGRAVAQVVVYKQTASVVVVVSSSPLRGAPPQAPLGC